MSLIVSPISHKKGGGSSKKQQTGAAKESFCGHSQRSTVSNEQGKVHAVSTATTLPSATSSKKAVQNKLSYQKRKKQQTHGSE